MDRSTIADRKEILLTPQEARLVKALRQVAKRSKHRPWMAVVRQVDGIITVQEALPPERIDNL